MSNIQEMFKEKFNQMIEQKEIRRKTDINEMALNYFKTISSMTPLKNSRPPLKSTPTMNTLYTIMA